MKPVKAGNKLISSQEMMPLVYCTTVAYGIIVGPKTLVTFGREASPLLSALGFGLAAGLITLSVKMAQRFPHLTAFQWIIRLLGPLGYLPAVTLLLYLLALQIVHAYNFAVLLQMLFLDRTPLPVIILGGMATAFYGAHLGFARGQSPVAPQEQFLSITATGATPWDALAQIDKITSRHLYLGHLQVIVVGEEMARRNINPVIDGLQRYAVINRGAVVVLASNARQILEAPVRGELTPAMYFQTFFSAKPTPESTENVPLWRVRHDLLMPAHAAHIPRVTLADVLFRLEGFGLIANGRLTGELLGAQARGLALARGRVREGSVALTSDDRSVTIRIEKVGRRLTGARWDGGEAHIRLSLDVRGQIEENDQLGLAVSPDQLARFEAIWADQVKQEAMNAISVAQKSGADVFNFDEYMRLADPRGWNPDRWAEKFRTADIQVSVRARIDRTGMFE